ncbi:hypothetical protein PPSQR21_038420 [Paenibacillus polymyxa SQR-21]|nr:hypothetical protein PPSQR21_038420 [Paenibacillus polymyxa SQR-21]
MTMGELMTGVQILVNTYQDSIFLSFTLLISFAVAVGIKRIFADL